MKDLRANLIVMTACYLYIVAIIVLAGFLKRRTLNSKCSRKFLHTMIGNLPLIMPYFTQSIFPFLVASPFIIITFFATPYNPILWIREKLSTLIEITEEGHQNGLMLYATSYTILAYFYGTKPYIVAAGIFPMAYGDSTAALLGMKYGRRKIGIKSIEGSIGMFLGSFIALLLGMTYFSGIYEFTLVKQLIPILLISIIVTFVELISPKGLDNITVPILGALTFIFAGGEL